MAASREDIRGWFDEGIVKGAKYMLVLCDTYDYDDYPVFAFDYSECLSRYKRPGYMQSVMEVYDLRATRDEQLNEYRTLRLPVADPNARS